MTRSANRDGSASSARQDGSASHNGGGRSAASARQDGPGAQVPMAGVRGQQVVVVHDYLTQRGGAERVVLAMLDAFPGCRLVTSVYNPATTFPELRARKVETLPLRSRRVLQRDHRLGLPLYGGAFRRARMTGADVVLCSSSGFAHLVGTDAPKVVYCYNPPRWLYQEGEYRSRRCGVEWAALRALGARLRRDDLAGARSATAYLAVSQVVAGRIRCAYGIDATVVHPPYGLGPDGPVTPVDGVPKRFLLLVARGRRYKNVGVAAAAAARARRPLVVVGGAAAGQAASPYVVAVGSVDEARLRWLYRHCSGVLALAHEDFGLTPVEGHAAGKPTLALRHGGYLETVEDGRNGAFIDSLQVDAVAAAMARFEPDAYDPATIVAGAERFSPARFAERLAAAVTGAVTAAAVAPNPACP